VAVLKTPATPVPEVTVREENTNPSDYHRHN
jgi:hypothetical protein